MNKRNNPLERLKHHVTGAIERGEATAIEAVVPAKHTPGPWVVAANKTIIRTGELLVASTEPMEAFIGTGLREYNKATREANARLIAAAPELLDAAQKLVSRIFKDAPECAARLNSADELSKMSEAIAKATGGAE